ncbi:hypothetical protein B0H11DRAFT_2002349, partial [Mycena galericulata]
MHELSARDSATWRKPLPPWPPPLHLLARWSPLRHPGSRPRLSRARVDARFLRADPRPRFLRARACACFLGARAGSFRTHARSRSFRARARPRSLRSCARPRHAHPCAHLLRTRAHSCCRSCTSLLRAPAPALVAPAPAPTLGLPVSVVANAPNPPPALPPFDSSREARLGPVNWGKNINGESSTVIKTVLPAARSIMRNYRARRGPDPHTIIACFESADIASWFITAFNASRIVPYESVFASP